jgi:hypothetical protein
MFIWIVSKLWGLDEIIKTINALSKDKKNKKRIKNNLKKIKIYWLVIN